MARSFMRGPDGNVPPVPEREGAPSHDVMPGFLHTWGIPILAGRDFNAHDLGRSAQCHAHQPGWCAQSLRLTKTRSEKTLLVTSFEHADRDCGRGRRCSFG